MKNKTPIDAVIVVEGKSDVLFLETFLEPIDFIITNGSEISKSTLNTIKELSKKYKIIVLTDPDFPGKKIRDIVNENIDNCYNAFVSKEVSIKKNKVGVAESTKDEVLKSLQNLHIFSKNNLENNITLVDLVSWGYLNIDQKEFRNYISKKYNFDEVNTKRFIKRINLLNIPIKEELESYGRK
jgi:ribonuclease M5